MRFFTLVALMAATASVSARAIPRSADLKALNARSSSMEVRASDAAPAANADPVLAAKDKKKGKKGKKGKKDKKDKKNKSSASAALNSNDNSNSNSNSNSTGSSSLSSSSSNSTNVNLNNNSNSTSVSSSSSSNNTSVDSASSSNSTSTSDNSSSSNNTASSTSTANSATRTRPCDQGDQSLAAGLTAAVVIGIGQQASVATIQATNNSADFQTAVTRLQQFVDTMGLQLQMAQGIADSDSFAQKQLGLLATSQTSQASAVKALTGNSAQENVQALNDLLNSFQASTDNAQDGAEQALIDCFLPVNAISG